MYIKKIGSYGEPDSCEGEGYTQFVISLVRLRVAEQGVDVFSIDVTGLTADAPV